MDQKNDVFDKTYNDYLAKLGDLDLPELAGKLNLKESGHGVEITLFGEKYLVSSAGIIDSNGQRAEFEECIVIFKYLLMCPDNITTDTAWVAYHSFKNAQPLLHYFTRETTKPIEEFFSGNLKLLERVIKKIGGVVVTDNASYDLSIQFNILSQVPLFLRFNDIDEDFPAQCTILFQETVERYLDMESVGILGALLARKLIKMSQKQLISSKNF